MSNEIVVSNGRGEVIEAVIAKGDLAKLTPDERVNYYRAVCESIGLNPLTRPFDYLILSGKTTLYARKDATEQLRKLNRVSLHDPSIGYADGLVTVTINASTPDGRNDFDLGAVSVEGLKGEARANAVMKAITKAKRRVTLSICGLGWLDETEVESIPDARQGRINIETGEIIEAEVKSIGYSKDVQFKPEPEPAADFWETPQAALAWAQTQGLSLNDARAQLTIAKNNNGGKFTTNNAVSVSASFKELVDKTEKEEATEPELEIAY